MASSTSTGASPVKSASNSPYRTRRTTDRALESVPLYDAGVRTVVRVQNRDFDPIQHDRDVPPRFKPGDGVTACHLQDPYIGVPSCRLGGVQHIPHVERLDDRFGSTDVIQIRMGQHKSLDPRHSPAA